MKEEAEAYEKEGRQAKKEKKYNLAILKLQKAIQIHDELQQEGYVGILEKEIERIKTLMDFLDIPLDLAKAKEEANMKDLDKKTNNEKIINEKADDKKHDNSNIGNEDRKEAVFENEKTKDINAKDEMVKRDQSDPTKKARKELEKEANTIESKIKTLSFQKKYNEIIKLYKRLSELYEQLGYDYQLRKIR